MSASASSSIAATFASRPSRCATASESRSRAWSSESALKIGRISAPSSAVLVLAGVPEAVSEEVDGAALPGAAQDLARSRPSGRRARR